LEAIQSLRGMVDLLPVQTPLWQRIEATAREHFRRAAIGEIRMPLLEATELFARGIGEATDVVGKEMYTFLDRGDRSCTLRPEGTASVVRAAIQHGLLAQGPQRLWYSGPMFRYERPQAGRQRQFHQIGVELLGVADATSDAEAIALSNASPFGLGGSVFGETKHAEKVARALDSGMIGVNKDCTGAHGTPWIGAKQSGFGFYRGTAGHRQFTQTRVVSRKK
jgi:histidyl-tRNA synthetase